MDATAEDNLCPDETIILEHLKQLFGGHMLGVPPDCRFEIAWADERDADDSGVVPLRHGRTFLLDELEDAAAFAVETNAPGVNVYVGGALRLPSAPHNARCSDEDVYGTMWLWGDLDSREAVEHANGIVARCRPNLAVQTGSIPGHRAHLWWRLNEVLTDLDRIREALAGIAVEIGGDAVHNPSRIMRLAGTVSWPSPKKRAEKNYIAELTRFVPVRGPVLTEYDIETIEAAYPPHEAISRSSGGGGDFTEPVWEPRGLHQVCVDGRHVVGRDIVNRHFFEWIGEHRKAPTPAELHARAWPEWRVKIDQERPGRGEQYCKNMCRSTCDRFRRGKLKNAKTLEEAIAKAEAWGKSHAEPEPEERIKTAEGGRFKFWNDTNFGELEPPEFLIDDWILKEGITLLWGPPGVWKSFVVLDMSLSVAGGYQWNGRDIDHPGDVVYFAAEGFRGIAGQRVKAWQKLHRREPTGRFWLVGESFRFPSAVGDMVKDMEAAGINPRLVVIDTLSKTVEGKENEDEVMRAYTKGAETLSRHLGCQVIVVHHSGKDEDRGPRGSSTLHGDWDVSLRVKRKGNDAITLLHHKAKDFEEIATDLSATTVSLGEHVKIRPDGTEKRRPISSLVVVPMDSGARPADAEQEGTEKGLGANQKAVLKILSRCHGRRSKHGTIMLATGIEKGNLNRALRTLCRDGYIKKVTTESGDEWYELQD